jgi:hypothetical protein
VRGPGVLRYCEQNVWGLSVVCCCTRITEEEEEKKKRKMRNGEMNVKQVGSRARQARQCDMLSRQKSRLIPPRRARARRCDEQKRRQRRASLEQYRELRPQVYRTQIAIRSDSCCGWEEGEKDVLGASGDRRPRLPVKLGSTLILINPRATRYGDTTTYLESVVVQKCMLT